MSFFHLLDIPNHNLKKISKNKKCTCQVGFWLQEDKHTCVDVDECRCMKDTTYLNKVTKSSDICTNAARVSAHKSENCLKIEKVLQIYSCFSFYIDQ